MKRFGRREFNKHAAATLAGGSLFSSLARAQEDESASTESQAPGPRVRPNVLYGLSTASWQQEVPRGSPLPLLRILDETAATGYNGVRLTHYPGILEQNDLSLEQLGDELDQRGLKFATIAFGGMYYDRTQHKDLMERAREVLRIHQHFGAKTMIMFPPPVPPDDTDEDEAFIIMGNFLNSLGRMAKEHYGVRVGMHNYLFTMVSSNAQIDKFLNTTDPRFVFCAWNTAHLHIGNRAKSVVEIFRSTFGRIVGVDFCDATRRPERVDYRPPNGEIHAADSGVGRFHNAMLELGRGVIPFPTLMDILKQDEFDGWIFNSLDTIRVSCVNSAQASMGYVRNYLDPIYE